MLALTIRHNERFVFLNRDGSVVGYIKNIPSKRVGVMLGFAFPDSVVIKREVLVSQHDSLHELENLIAVHE